jgi:hypothetical protein
MPIDHAMPNIMSIIRDDVIVNVNNATTWFISLFIYLIEINEKLNALLKT